MKSKPSQLTYLTMTRHVLLVMLLCYLPHFISAPWWIFIIIFLAIGYRLVADYYGYYSHLKLWIRISIIIICFYLLKINYENFISSECFIGFLLIYISLKCTEIQEFRDLKVLVLCNFLLIFAALLSIQELWIIIYLIVAILANLSLMLKLNAPQASLRQIGGKSIKQILIAIPLTLILFYIFPRMTHPLWSLPSQSSGRMGFNESMTPGSITKLFNDESTALRVTFKEKPILNGYWKGIFLNFFDGNSWTLKFRQRKFLSPLKPLPPTDLADYEILLEPHQKKWLFYTGYPLAARPNLLFAANIGLVNYGQKKIERRFVYALDIKKATPYQLLSSSERQENIQLPDAFNPKLNAWAKTQFALVHNNLNAFINFLKQYINQQPFWYSLNPSNSDDKNQMDIFWFDTKRGFCEHYAGAVTEILRAVGIPAHVVLGYHGGTWNPLGQYLTLKQNDAHAWIEYWQDGVGWQEFDPTSFINPARIDQEIKNAEDFRMTLANYNTETTPWLQQVSLFFNSARFFADRWLLFYNQETQRALLKNLGLSNWNPIYLLKIALFSIVFFIIIFGFLFHWLQKRREDPLLSEYHLLQKEFRRFNISTVPHATLHQQCINLGQQVPSLTPILFAFLNQYDKLRFCRFYTHTKENKKATLKLFRSLRKNLNQTKRKKH